MVKDYIKRLLQHVALNNANILLILRFSKQSGISFVFRRQLCRAPF